MDNTCSNSYSQSILDKFRLISKQSEDSQNASSKVSVNGQCTNSSEPNGNSSGCKRKFSKTEDVNDGQPGIKEPEVGITQYISSLEGFSGIIKHRFSDFQVNEIDPSGNVAELTSLDVPVEEPQEEESNDHLDILTSDHWAKIEEIVNSNDNSVEPLLIDVTEKSKEERTSVHLILRKTHGSKIISNTKEMEDKKFIEIKKKIKKDARTDWPRGRADYLHCALFKVNKDTTELIHLLSDKLKTKVNSIGYAGTKDKRAKTTQRISIKRRTAEAVLQLKIRNVMFGNFSYSKNEILLGNNKGNRFKISIRNVTASDQVIESQLMSLRDKGFINYFGLQRFGSYSLVPTYAVGKALLASDWKLAVELILKPRPNVKAKRELLLALQSWYKDRNAASAIRWISKFDNSVEAKILRTLKVQGNTAYMNALMSLPRHTMTMYLHSYQSLIWNRVVSKRLEKFGLKPVPGDLVVVEETVVPPNEDKDEKEEEEEENVNKDNQSKSDQDKRSKITRKMKVRVITEDEVESIPISDVVYPLPGHDVTFPNNEIKSWYEEILAESNFTLDDLNNTHKHFSLGGTYRRLLAKPDNLSWKFVSFNDLDQDLILSDGDKLNKVALPETCDDGKYRAVILTFNLDSCCYATMALREIMKCDTSSHHHSQLTEQLSESHLQQSKKQKT